MPLLQPMVAAFGIGTLADLEFKEAVAEAH
jgi:hypothetical protein